MSYYKNEPLQMTVYSNDGLDSNLSVYIRVTPIDNVKYEYTVGSKSGTARFSEPINIRKDIFAVIEKTQHFSKKHIKSTFHLSEVPVYVIAKKMRAKLSFCPQSTIILL